jgi:serine phosphatase RsbU (regulator of sigma subunit)
VFPSLTVGRGFGRVLLRVSIVTIAALLLLFVAVAALVQTSVRQLLAQENAVRDAEIARSLVLRLQIDEETGLRGYVITNRRSFLLPFDQARLSFAAAARGLESRLARVDPSLVPLARELPVINARWVAGIALPTIATSSARRRGMLEVNGKALVDRFRSVSQTIGTRLDAFANERDGDANATITHLLDGSIAFGALLAIVLLFYAALQVRLAHALASQAEEYERLRRISTALQQAFLADPLPQLPHIKFDAVYAPALQESRVGGDWYGVFALPNGRIYISMGDVQGHGIEASVTMARVRQTILSIALHETDPAIVLARANEVLRLRSETMVTAFCGFLDPETLEISYASAGHPAPLLVSKAGDAAALPVGGVPLGVAPDPGARTYVRRASPESMLVCYTDGLIESTATSSLASSAYVPRAGT